MLIRATLAPSVHPQTCTESRCKKRRDRRGIAPILAKVEWPSKCFLQVSLVVKPKIVKTRRCRTMSNSVVATILSHSHDLHVGHTKARRSGAGLLFSQKLRRKISRSACCFRLITVALPPFVKVFAAALLTAKPKDCKRTLHSLVARSQCCAALRDGHAMSMCGWIQCPCPAGQKHVR